MYMTGTSGSVGDTHYDQYVNLISIGTGTSGQHGVSSSWGLMWSGSTQHNRTLHYANQQSPGSWTQLAAGGDVVAGSTFTTAGVIMACNGDDKEIDEPGTTLTTNGQGMTVGGAFTVGSNGTGHDVIFYSDTSGDYMKWEDAEVKLGITGTNGKVALHVADGDVLIADTLNVSTAVTSTYGVSGNIGQFQTLQTNGAVVMGYDAAGSDVTLYSETAGDKLVWEAAEVKLAITGTNGATALHVADGNVVIADDLYVQGGNIVVDAAATTIEIIDNNSAGLAIKEGSNTYLTFNTTNGEEGIELSKGLFTAEGSDSVDIGSSQGKFNAVYATNVYTGDLHLKNERGDWSVIEEANYLTVRHNSSGKRFKIVMEELSEGEYGPGNDGF
jgi:hypothetical protein